VARRRSGSSATKPRHQHRLPVASPQREAAQPGTGAPAVSGEAAAAEPEALVVTYWFDSGNASEPYDATVRLTGRRTGTRGAPRAGDTFSKDETIKGIVPGTGPISITVWVYGLQHGEWEVDARLVSIPGRARPAGPKPGPLPAIQRATWSWRRWAPTTVPAAPIRTRWALLAPLATQPAVIPGVYTALAVIGFVLALTLQSALLVRSGTPFEPPLAVSVLALVAGLIGAKAWYAVLHPDESPLKGGWAVDGFLVVAPLVAAVALFAWNIPIGRVLDATAPGIFFAVALGRVGCFLTGCCAGRCTASPWGVWSSDRRVGARRIPTQLLESAAGLTLGVVTLLIVLDGGLAFAGSVFVAGFVVYALVRQALLRLRAERRREYRTLPLTAVAAGAVAVVIAALSLAQGV
jgi:phosphatidylglycerol---prolipoprotein diacylglyceryl transferase